VICSLLLLFCCGTVTAEELTGSAVLDLPLERLLDVSVVSPSRKTQLLSDVASAVFVISSEDVRRSGATSIPELLRMVPGLQVGSIDGTTWAVSARGFNGTFSNKLLVLIDGRTVYTPLYGGVFWDVQDTLLENIERIEVIRGSGSTMWGANAVNGVISIITKHPIDTAGTLFTGLTGSRERANLGARYGASLGENTQYRFYVKHLDRDGLHAVNGPAPDSLHVTRGGFRLDSSPREAVNLTVQGDLYGGTSHRSDTVPSFTPPFVETTFPGAEVSGGNLLLRGDWLQSSSSKYSVQAYFDRTRRDTPLVRETRDTVDLDLQHNIRLNPVHEVTWGAGYRFLHDRSAGSTFFFLVPERSSDHLVNLFVQDEITLVQDTLRLILGSKVEHNDYTQWEWQPSAKLSWTPARGYSLWASASRAVRTPTRGENDVNIGLAYIPPIPPATPATLVMLTGNRDLSSESLLAYELGFRADLHHAVSLDVSSFYNRYDHIIGTQFGTPVLGPGFLTVPNRFTNLYSFDSTGLEASLQWQPLDYWKLKGGYSFIRFLGDDQSTLQGEKGTPTHQGTLRSMLTLARNVDLDLWARYVGASTYQMQSQPVSVPAYLTLDLRLAWRPVTGMELSLVGQNLLERRHLEAVSDQALARHEVGPSVYGKVAWEF
jgi:iron complex outermembrane receptor protein